MMDTAVVTLQLPPGVYNDLKELAAAEQTDLETVVARLGAKPAVEPGNRIGASSHFLIVYLTADDRRATWDIFSRHIDKDWSYVDCSVLAVAGRLRAAEVLAFDRHFDQMPELARVPSARSDA